MKIFDDFPRYLAARPPGCSSALLSVPGDGFSPPALLPPLQLCCLVVFTALRLSVFNFSFSSAFYVIHGLYGGLFVRFSSLLSTYL